MAVEALLRPGFDAGSHVISRSAQSYPSVLGQGGVASVIIQPADDDAIAGERDGAVATVPHERNVMPLTVVDG